MKTILLLLCLTVSLFASNKNILLLHSYNKGLVWTDNISKGVEKVLKVDETYELTTEYMDSLKNDFPGYKDIIYSIFSQKLIHQKYDVVIAADNFAVNFVLQYKDRLFKDTPMIFCGLDKDNPGVNIQKALNEKISIVLENTQIATNIELIKKLLPDTKNIYIINGPKPSSRLVNQRIEKVMRSYGKDMMFYLNSDGYVEQIKEDFQNLPKNSAVLFRSIFRDKDGKYVPFYKVNEMLKSSPVPVFVLLDYFLSKGVVGGVITKGEIQGEEAARIALKHLLYKEVKYDKPVLARAEMVFDYKVLEKFGIDMSNIPKTAKIINTPKSFFDENRELVERVFLVFPFVVIFLLIAVVNILKRRKVEKQLVAQSYLQTVLLNNIQSFVFWIDKKGYIQGCNESFCDFFKIEQCQVIGKNIDEFFQKRKLGLSRADLLRQNTVEFSHDKKDYIVRNKKFLNEDSMDAGIVSIITDISEKKQLEINKQFIIQQSKLSEIGEMLSAITHQWKIPLVELSAVAHKMQYYHRKKKLDGENIEHFFETIMKQIIFMGDTIDNFRAFVKPSAKPILFNIDMGIKEILSILSSSLKYENIKIEFMNNLDIEADLFGYPNEFKQVLLNIINNAKDSILEKRVTTKSCGNIKIFLDEVEKYHYITIEDDGLGVKDSVLPHIFDSFFSTKSKGDGIGLYMAKLIIEKKMNGSISAHNSDKGAVFVIMLPKIPLEESA